MGLEPFNVSSAVNLVLAQRLVRCVCEECKGSYTITDEELQSAKITRNTTYRDLRFTEEALRDAVSNATVAAAPFLTDVTLDTKIADVPLWKGRGCAACSGLGLKGRQGLYEVMYLTPRLRRLILQSVSAAEIQDAGIEEGMLTLRMDGWLKILKGVAPLEQVLRETSA